MCTHAHTSASHRPWPPPPTPWVIAQTWRDLLFAHWPVPVETLRPRVPLSLPIDTYQGQAWLGIVPFRMSGVRLRALPALPRFSAFPELNVRTYVTLDSKPGVFFLSLDAANPVAVAAARIAAHLPYFNADMHVQPDGDAVHYASHRTHQGARPADLIVSWQPVGPAAEAVPGSLADWLTARYCLYAADRRGRISRVEIDHQPWQLQPAEADFAVNTMAAAHRIPLPDAPPLLHFSRRLDVRVWRPRPLS